MGVRVASIRQKAGRVLKPAAATPGGGPNGEAGGWKPPAGTSVAATTLPCGRAAPASSEQSLAVAGVPIASITPNAVVAAAAAMGALRPSVPNLIRAICAPPKSRQV